MSRPARLVGDKVHLYIRTVLGLIILAQAACTLVESKEVVYLKSAQDRANEQEVRQRMGVPKFTATSQAGEPILVYQVLTEDPTNQNMWGAPGTWCDEYVLTFDKQGVLRRWTQKTEGHGGELMPKYCVTGGFKPPS